MANANETFSSIDAFRIFGHNLVEDPNFEKYGRILTSMGRNITDPNIDDLKNLLKSISSILDCFLLDKVRVFRFHHSIFG